MSWWAGLTGSLRDGPGDPRGWEPEAKDELRGWLSAVDFPWEGGASTGHAAAGTLSDMSQRGSLGFWDSSRETGIDPVGEFRIAYDEHLAENPGATDRPWSFSPDGERQVDLDDLVLLRAADADDAALDFLDEHPERLEPGFYAGRENAPEFSDIDVEQYLDESERDAQAASEYDEAMAAIRARHPEAVDTAPEPGTQWADLRGRQAEHYDDYEPEPENTSDWEADL